MTTEPGSADTGMGSAEQLGDLDAGLVDVTGLTLGHLESIDRSSLGLALRRVLDPQDNADDAVVGFQAAL